MERTMNIRSRNRADRARAARAFALGLGLGLAFFAASSVARADAVVRQISGHVELGRGEPPVWSPLEVGAHVAANERVRTGSDGRVELAVEAGTLRVHENSLLKLPPSSHSVDRVELEVGHSLFDVIRREGRRFEVRTPTVVVSVKGTRFGVEASSESEVVSVYRGVVGVRSSAATEVVETLVREGFLAAGGGNRPLELDVMSEGDPWSAWQQFRTSTGPVGTTQPPTSEIDRARTSLRRSTDVDVVKRAAERKPEIAERLRQQAADAKRHPASGTDARGRESAPSADPAPASPDILDPIDASGGSKDDSTRPPDGIRVDGDMIDTKEGRPGALDSIRGDGGPDRLEVDDATSLLDSTRGSGGNRASLDGGGLVPGGSIDVRDAQRELLDSQRAKSALDRADDTVDLGAVTGGAPLPGGQTTYDFSSLEGLDPRLMIQLMDALQDMQTSAANSARAWSESDITNFLRNDLESMGVDGNVAQSMVERLLGK